MSDIPNPISESATTPAQAAPILEHAPLPEPVEAPSAMSSPLAIRLWCALAFALAFGMLATGFILSPNPAGTGTHQQMGMPPCQMLARSGIPCPTCGCTTAVSNFSHGNLWTSFRTQPFGFALAAVALLLTPLAGFGILTGKWRGPSMFTLSWHWPYWVYSSLAIFFLAWFYKIAAIRLGL
jgi:hypothetical protein